MYRSRSEHLLVFFFNTHTGIFVASFNNFCSTFQSFGAANSKAGTVYQLELCGFVFISIFNSHLMAPIHCRGSIWKYMIWCVWVDGEIRAVATVFMSSVVYLSTGLVQAEDSHRIPAQHLERNHGVPADHGVFSTSPHLAHL